MKNILLFLMLFLTVQTFTQSTVRGSVTDDETGELLPFANVVIYKNGELLTGAQTDFDGNFEMKNIPSGDYRVEVSYAGYETLIQQDINVLKQAGVGLDFGLKSGVTLTEVVVCGFYVPLISHEICCGGGVSHEECFGVQEQEAEPAEKEKKPEVQTVFEIKTFPNPVSDLLTIAFSDESPKSIFLTNSSGILMRKESIENRQYQINVSQFEQGTYFLKIENGKQSRTEKVIILH